MIPVGVDLLWVSHQTAAFSGFKKGPSELQLAIAEARFQLWDKITQIAVVTQRVLDSLGKQEFIIRSRVAQRAPSLITCGASSIWSTVSLTCDNISNDSFCLSRLLLSQQQNPVFSISFLYIQELYMASAAAVFEQPEQIKMFGGGINLQILNTTNI